MDPRRRRILELLGAGSLLAVSGCSGLVELSAESRTWSRQARLDSDDDIPSFGVAVATSTDGTTAVVGNPWDDEPNGPKSGSASVFERSDGEWSTRAKLTAPDGDAYDMFGDAVATLDDGSTVAVGVPSDSANGDESGSVYVFDVSDDSWTQRTKLVADDGDSVDGFGSLLAVSEDGTTGIIGSSGSAFVFERVDGSWSQQDELTADNRRSDDRFGSSIAVADDGSTVLVGAPDDYNSDGQAAGSGYLFDRSNGSWSRDTKLTAENAADSDRFGTSVALLEDGAVAVVGAVNAGTLQSNGSGRAYVFERSGGSWSQRTELSAKADGEDLEFGSSIATSADGTTVAISAVDTASRSESPEDRVSVFDRSGGSWSRRTEFVHDDEQRKLFGHALAVSAQGETIVVGSPAANDEESGSAYALA